ncbi:kinase-like protein [Meira miltonrushii]|uniref:non-specific serine/threonine protein kinase n=1 Tax=Meira miltonrushii TaxID=1280837 RepID=A0A316V136_9BASI|nr:kinase-like protein [Meira miltonrushii]PWN31267.1 kinase-like protein [Meira miltonrushii]
MNRSLIISDEILGYGSSGTIVFKGNFQGCAVAVKRLLRDFVDVASKEVSLLESADNHANVIRYFYKEVTDSFLYIALELCPANLAEVIEKPNENQSLSAILKPKKALSQIASGLQYLHSLSIVHRELKMLSSDFGLSKRLDGVAQTSFSQTVNNPGGAFAGREVNILRRSIDLQRLAFAQAHVWSLHRSNVELHVPLLPIHPNTLKILSHPYFWDSYRRLSFLQDASDRFDIMERDPPVAPLVLVTLEANAVDIVGNDWHRMEDLNKRRKYDPKKHCRSLTCNSKQESHIHDLPHNVKRLITIADVQLLSDGFLTYFTSRTSESSFVVAFEPFSDEI